MDAHLHTAAEAAGCLADECGDEHSEDELDYQVGGVHTHNIAAEQNQLEFIGYSNNAQQVGRHCQQQRQRLIPPGRCCKCHSHTCANGTLVTDGYREAICSLRVSFAAAAGRTATAANAAQTSFQ